MQFVDTLSAWERLDLDSRWSFLELKPSGDHHSNDLEPEALGELAGGGLVEHVGSVVRVAVVHRAFSKAMRAMDRARVLDADARPDRPGERSQLSAYLVEHFTLKERQELCAHPRQAVEGLPQLAGSYLWIDQFFQYVRRRVREADQGAAEGADTFDDSSDAGVTNASDRLDKERRQRLDRVDLAVLIDCYWLVDSLLSAMSPWSVEDAFGIFLEKVGDPSDGPVRLAEALQVALNEVLVLACIDANARPMIGLWPAAAKALEGRRVLAADPVAAESPSEVIARPVMVEDMLALLVECAVAPPRMKAGGFVMFSRNQDALAARLTPLPPWIGSASTGWSLERRCDAACRQAYALGFVTLAGTPGKDLRMVLTASGESWTALSPKARLRYVIDRLSRDPRSRFRPRGDVLEEGPLTEGVGVLSFVPVSLQMWDPFWSVDPLPALVAAYRRGSSEVFLRLAPFLHQQALAHSPFSEKTSSYRWISREDTEASWLNVLVTFFFLRLFALGAIALGVDNEDFLFRLTSVGRFLLGEAPDFELDSPIEKTEVVVQPNLEIVFLAPSPGAELEISAFASPTRAQQNGHGVGTLYRLTKASVQRAAAGGYDAARLVGALRNLSTQALPANVATQVQAWLQAVRWAEARPALLVEAGDAETAIRVLAAAGKEAKLISDTVVELPPAASVPSRTLKKLVEAGVFVRERTAPDGR